MVIVLSIALIAIGLWAFVGIFVPKYRSRWRGTGHPTGPTTHLGFGLGFTACGTMFLTTPEGQEPPIFLAVCVILGLLFGFVGSFIDSWVDEASKD